MIYVASQSGLSTTQVGKDPCSEHDYTQAGADGPRDSCGKLGAPAPPPGYVPPARGATPEPGGRGGGASHASYKTPSPGTSAIAGISILKPRQLGGITAYDMKSGEKAWWIPNGGQMVVPTPQPASPDAALFAGVTLPPQPAGRGQAQVITTKSLVDLWNRQGWRAARRRQRPVPDLRGGQGDRQGSRRGADSRHGRAPCR